MKYPEIKKILNIGDNKLLIDFIIPVSFTDMGKYKMTISILFENIEMVLYDVDYLVEYRPSKKSHIEMEKIIKKYINNIDSDLWFQASFDNYVDVHEIKDGKIIDWVLYSIYDIKVIISSNFFRKAKIKMLSDV